MSASQYRTKPEETSSMPKGVPFIIGNEAAERFSFYGMRTILVVFMTKYLHWMVDGAGAGTPMSDAAANAKYHEFIFLTYLFPVFGSLLSDVLIGKYRTILYLSIVYCVGHGALAMMGGPGLLPATWLSLGLFLISFGSGGIKPCVSAHVGDQFGPKNSHLMTRVFQWFYFSINFGSTLSTWMTPLLLEWYGPHWAFGVPGVLMALATFLFWMGRNRFIHVPAAGRRFFTETFSREGLVALAKLSVIYALIAVFWGMFDQTGSSWVIQADNMDRRFLGVEWLQSQIQVVNPILVMALIPIFQFGLYPALDKVFRLTPLRKMGIGFFLTAASFVLVARAQELIDAGQVPSIAWQLWAYLLLTAGEIMISITGLEFSYTQAPKTMKSVVMAVWLLSVSLGNLFVSVVNSSIQTDGIAELEAVTVQAELGQELEQNEWKFRVETAPSAPEESSSVDSAAADTAAADDSEPDRLVTVAGPDGAYGTADDVAITITAMGETTGVVTSENSVLEEASAKIEEAFFASPGSDQEKVLPSGGQGNGLISDMKDSLGNPLTYTLLSRNRYRIASAGADGQNLTRWDVILSGSVNRVSQADPSDADRPYNWLERRKIEVLGERGRRMVEEDRGRIDETAVSTSITVGGQDTLEGAAYFWYWVRAISIAAVLFVIVAVFYKEKSYIQTESEGDDAPTDDDGRDTDDSADPTAEDGF